MDAFELCGIAVITSVLALTLRQYRPELAVHVSIGGGALLLLAAAAQFSGITQTVQELFSNSGIGEGWLRLVLKVTGVAYITQISSELCRDMGEGALAVKTELCGRLMMLSLTAPAVLSLISILTGLASLI